jgi:FkbM family methyltransferase
MMSESNRWRSKRFLRRSGVAVGSIMEHLGWDATKVFIVGVGIQHQEANVMKDGWLLSREDIIGFEPHPGSCKKIRDRFPGILHEMAVGDEISTVTLYGKKSHRDGSSIHSPKDMRGIHTNEVPIVTLDHMLGNRAKGFDVPDWKVPQNVLLWLDCEGNELSVIRGAKSFLRYVDVVNVEMTCNPKGNGWCNPLDVHNELKSIGFRQQHMHSHRSSAGQFDSIYVRNRLWKREFCCCLWEW